jgi:hypothetical protein
MCDKERATGSMREIRCCGRIGSVEDVMNRERHEIVQLRYDVYSQVQLTLAGSVQEITRNVNERLMGASLKMKMLMASSSTLEVI